MVLRPPLLLKKSVGIPHTLMQVKLVLDCMPDLAVMNSHRILIPEDGKVAGSQSVSVLLWT